MYTKIQITGKIEVRTGMHIGGSDVFSPIGSVDSPVVKDARTNQPMIPGSSLKGKMRALLARQYNVDYVAGKPDEDAECLIRLFGSAKKGKTRRSRVLVSDCFLKNEEELRRQGLQGMTEIKFENTINRATSVANPRQIERVIRGTVFGMDMIYELDDKQESSEEEFLQDMELLAEGMRLLQYDYLGGNGSRGYGKIAFRDIHAEAVIGVVDPACMVKCNEILGAAEECAFYKWK